MGPLLQRLRGATGTPAGIALMLFGMMIFTANDTLGKYLLRDYPVGQMLMIRSVAGLMMLGPSIWRAGWRSIVQVKRPGLQLLRLVFILMDVGFFFWAVRYLPLATALAIFMAGPLLITALSAPLLGERVGPRRWAAVIVGFCGVVLILRPDTGEISWPHVVILLGCFGYAMMNLLTRKLRDTPQVTLITWHTVAILLAGGATVPFAWVTPSVLDFVLLGSLGVVATIGHMCVNKSLQLAPAAVVTPFQYTMVVWACLFGFLFLGEVPDVSTLLGAAVVVASGLYILHREQVNERAAKAGASPAG